jgi:exosortase C (VPDSG-CTERM-specific)
MVWVRKNTLPDTSAPAGKAAAVFSGISLAVLAWCWLAPVTGINGLALTTLAFVLFLTGAGCWRLGGALMRALAFPFALLLFMVPFPLSVRDGIETFLQHGSAVVADGMFRLAGTPLFRDGMLFHLPGMDIKVAPECSGIHSTLVLLITSLVAGQLLLQRPWKRWLLCLVVLPLALLRNGFRVFVIGELCVHVGPRMIDSPIHHKGGPIFFVLSLVPFFLLLYLLREKHRAVQTGQPAKSKN